MLDFQIKFFDFVRVVGVLRGCWYSRGDRYDGGRGGDHWRGDRPGRCGVNVYWGGFRRSVGKNVDRTVGLDWLYGKGDGLEECFFEVGQFCELSVGDRDVVDIYQSVYAFPVED